jgi:hypothetical protein
MFAYGEYDEEDREADRIWEGIDDHMDERRRVRCAGPRPLAAAAWLPPPAAWCDAWMALLAAAAGSRRGGGWGQDQRPNEDTLW